MSGGTARAVLSTAAVLAAVVATGCRPVATRPADGPSAASAQPVDVVRVGMTLSTARAALDAAGGQDVTNVIGAVAYVDVGTPNEGRGETAWYSLPDGQTLQVVADDRDGVAGGPIVVRRLRVGDRSDKFEWSSRSEFVDAVDLGRRADPTDEARPQVR